jgi:hypothetical protein
MKTKKKISELTRNEKKLQDATLRAIEMISNTMVSEKMTDIDLIKSFEFIKKSLKLRKLDINDVALFMYNSKNEKFDLFDKYFKNVQKIIRKNAENSILFDKMINVIKETEHPKTRLMLTEKQTKQAYSYVLNWYDPNKSQSIKDRMFRWEGFWSLIETKDGIVVGVYLSDTMDSEIFYEALSNQTVLKKQKSVSKKKKDN